MTTQTPESAFSSLHEALGPKPFVIVGEMTPDQANQLAFPGDHEGAASEQEALARKIGGPALSKLVEGQMAFGVVVGRDPNDEEVATHYVALTHDIGTAVRPRTDENKAPGYFESNNMPEPTVALEGLRKRAAAERGQTAVKLHRETMSGIANRVKAGDLDEASRFARVRLDNAIQELRGAKNTESTHVMRTEVALLMGVVADENRTRDVFAAEVLPAVTGQKAKEAIGNALEDALRAIASQDPRRAQRAIEQVGWLAYELQSKSETPKDQTAMVWAMAVGMAARYNPDQLEGDLLRQFEKSVRESHV
jgi:hypothetical protein